MAGNVIERHMGDIQEQFAYDALHRLTGTTRTINGTQSQFETRYDAIGNIVFKAGVGDYSYTGAQPHAVTQAGEGSYSYDLRGNQTARPGYTLTHTAQDKLRAIRDAASGEVRASYAYDAAATRVLHQDSEGTRVYVGGLYEKHLSQDGTIYHKWTIQAPQGTAVEIRRTEQGGSVTEHEYYPVQDRLGSPVVITDQDGNVVQRHVFDAWGKLENQEKNGTVAERPILNLGYTGHKAEDTFGIIDMGGRQYDPQLARFLQPDVFVQAPHNMQSFNRYSYAMNNPFRYVDPSGYVAESQQP